MEYYAGIRKDELMQLAETWLDLVSIILSEMSQKENTDIELFHHLYDIKKHTMIIISKDNRNKSQGN